MAFVEFLKNKKIWLYWCKNNIDWKNVVSCKSFSRATKYRSFESFDKWSTCCACMWFSLYSLKGMLSFATKKSMTTSVKWLYGWLCVKSHVIYWWGMWLLDDEMVIRWKVSIFVIFISYIWHSWLMTKWCGSPIVIAMIFKGLKVIYYEHRQPYPPPAYIPTYLFTHPPIYQPTSLPTHLFTYPLTHLPTFSTYLLFHIFLQPTYLPPIILQLVYYLLHSVLMIWNKHVK